ncbi:hypothetical protein EOM81_07905 [bacterium]|nr:hypothetical protein [bacterium]
MVDSQKIFATMIVFGAILLLYQMEMISRDRNRLKKQAIAYGYAEHVIESDRIVFKWKIPASATAELK